MRDVSTFELQTLIALQLLKNEKNVIVKMFTEDRTKLKTIEWSSETSFEKAMETYQKEIVSRKYYLSSLLSIN
jgi:hypothetical protein